MVTEIVTAALLLLCAAPDGADTLRPLPTRAQRPEATRVAAAARPAPAWDDPDFGAWMVERHAAGDRVIACGVAPRIHGARTTGTVYLDFGSRLVWVDLAGVDPPFQLVRYAMPGSIEPAPQGRAWVIRSAMQVDFWVEASPASRRSLRLAPGGSSEVAMDGEAPCDAPLPLPR